MREFRRVVQWPEKSLEGVGIDCGAARGGGEVVYGVVRNVIDCGAAWG